MPLKPSETFSESEMSSVNHFLCFLESPNTNSSLNKIARLQPLASFVQPRPGCAFEQAYCLQVVPFLGVTIAAWLPWDQAVNTGFSWGNNAVENG